MALFTPLKLENIDMTGVAMKKTSIKYDPIYQASLVRNMVLTVPFYAFGNGHIEAAYLCQAHGVYLLEEILNAAGITDEEKVKGEFSRIEKEILKDLHIPEGKKLAVEEKAKIDYLSSFKKSRILNEILYEIASEALPIEVPL